MPNHRRRRPRREPVGRPFPGDLPAAFARDDAGPFVEPEVAEPDRRDLIQACLPGESTDLVVMGDDGQAVDKPEAWDPAADPSRRPGTISGSPPER